MRYLILSVLLGFATQAAGSERCYHKLRVLYPAPRGTKTSAMANIVKKYKPSNLMIAIASRESRFDPRAVSTAGARGLYQITPIALRDAMTACEKLKYNVNKLHDPEYNYVAFTCFSYVVKNKYLDGSPSAVAFLAYYNGGMRQVNRLRRGLQLAPETAGYIADVLYRLDLCSDK